MSEERRNSIKICLACHFVVLCSVALVCCGAAKIETKLNNFKKEDVRKSEEPREVRKLDQSH